MIDGRGPTALILTVFQEDGLGHRMGAQEADEFRAAVPVEADDADLIFIHCLE